MMSRVIFQQSLRNLLDQKPFKPFVIEEDDGRRFQIDRREDLDYLAGDNAIYFGPGQWSYIVCDYVRQILELDSNAKK
jgi:hypothetical protein